MGCASCAQKYAALKAARQKQKNNAPEEKQAPRKVPVARRGVIRKADKIITPEPKKEEVPNEANNPN